MGDKIVSNSLPWCQHTSTFGKLWHFETHLLRVVEDVKFLEVIFNCIIFFPSHHGFASFLHKSSGYSSCTWRCQLVGVEGLHGFTSYVLFMASSYDSCLNYSIPLIISGLASVWDADEPPVTHVFLCLLLKSSLQKFYIPYSSILRILPSMPFMPK